jgi:hypothetical protein
MIRRSLAGARAYEGASEEGGDVGGLDGSGVGLAHSDDVIHAVVPGGADRSGALVPPE